MTTGMFRTMAASPRVYLANPVRNMAEITKILHLADTQGVQLCVFPELCLTGSTCGDLFFQPALLNDALTALRALAALPFKTAFVVGMPIEIGGGLYNCAVIVSRGQCFVIPKEHADPRHFLPGSAAPSQMQLWGRTVPVGRDLRFEAGDTVISVCAADDVPASDAAPLVVMPGAQPEVVTHHSALCRRLAQHSEEHLCAYVYAGAGYGESTTDHVFSGYAAIYEAGTPLAENERFTRASSYVLADVDIDRLRFKRLKRRTAPSAAAARTYALDVPAFPAEPNKLLRPLSAAPFLPDELESDTVLHDALMIQTQGLLTRMEHIRTQKLVLGVSGGLDSTLALLVAAYAFDRAGWARSGIVGITMPGFGTGSRTRANADKLMDAIGCTQLTIPISPAVTQHFSDIGQSADVHDVCYENSQARERTQIIMDYANKIGALALGTGDLSEIALGFCTYNGDHMGMYNVNGSVPKTLMRLLVRSCAELLGSDVLSVALDIIDTPISPELLPGKNGEIAQRTEEVLGAYDIHDFFLYHMMDSGAAPKKLFVLAQQAFDGRFDRETLLRALRTFVRRFFTQQFKRSCMPDGAAIGDVSFSPRGAWQMPSDAQMDAWLREVDELDEAESAL